MSGMEAFALLKACVDYIEQLEAIAREWEVSAMCACEFPREDCRCAGCLYAEERWRSGDQA